MLVKDRGQLAGIGSLFLPCRLWGLNSGYEPWQWMVFLLFCVPAFHVSLRVYGEWGSSSVFCLHWVNGGPVLGTQDLPGVCGFPAVPEAIVLFFLHWMILASMSKAIRDMGLVLRPHLCFSSVLTCLSFLVSTTSVDYHCFIASLNIHKCESSGSSKSTLTYFGSLTVQYKC